jgi:hypothetical protein
MNRRQSSYALAPAVRSASSRRASRRSFRAAQGEDEVIAEALHLADLEPAVFGLAQKLAEERQLRVGKDVAIREERSASGLGCRRLADSVEQKGAAWTKQTPRRAQVLGQVRHADVLDHADALFIVSPRRPRFPARRAS